METKSKSKKKPDRAVWLEAYREYVLKEEKIPSSAFKLANYAGLTESGFYGHFSSVQQLDSAIWMNHLDEVFDALAGNPEWNGFSGREKVLLFFFSLVQQLKKDRSFICWSAGNLIRPGRPSAARREITARMKNWFAGILDESAASGEVKDRMKLSAHYSTALLGGFWFILSFWCRDESPDFEDSDALIEKSIGLGFDLLGESPLEKAFDLGRFLFGRLNASCA